MNAEVQRMIYKVLVYRKDCRGRAIKDAIPELHILKYDRLLPTVELPDVSDFEHRAVPFVAVFWRMRKTDRVFHACPLVTIGVPGLTYDSWTVDGLHSWALGGLGATISFGLQFAMKSPVFRPLCVHLDAADIDRLALNNIKTLLMLHYKTKRKDPEWKKRGREAGLQCGLGCSYGPMRASPGHKSRPVGFRWFQASSGGHTRMGWAC